MKLFLASLLAVATLAVAGTEARYGVDVSSLAAASTDAVKCFENHEIHNEDNRFYSYINIRMGNSSGLIQAGLDTIVNAIDNINMVDILIDICPKKVKNTYTQVTQILQKLATTNGARPLYTTQYVYMSAMQTSDEDCWFTSGDVSDVNKNIAALSAGLSAIRTQSKYLGIKTNKENWTALTNNWDGIAKGGWQLWWVSEGPASFENFEGFGGWSGQPALRQYQQNVQKCNTAVNLNFGRDDYICAGGDQYCDDGCCGGSPCGDQIPDKCPVCATNGVFFRC